MKLKEILTFLDESTEGPWFLDEMANRPYPAINGARIVNYKNVHIASISRKADKPINQKIADAKLIIAAINWLNENRQRLNEFDESQTP